MSALLIIIAFESMNALFDDHFYQAPYDGLRVKLKNELSLDPKNKLDFIVLGDCYPLIGIIPKIIEGRSGLHGFNFSTHLAYSIFSSYCFLKNYLGHCAQNPRYIILSFLPESCRLTKKEIEQDDFAYFYDFSKHNAISFIREFGLPKSIPLMVPSLKHQYLFKNPLESIPVFKSMIKDSNKADEYIEQVKADKGRSDLVEDNIFITFPVKNKLLEKFQISEFFDSNLRSMLDLAKRDNITVIYIIPTRPAETYKAEMSSGTAQAYLDYLRSLQIKYPGLIVLSPQKDFDQVFSYSGDLHLNFWGSMSLSGVVAGKIRELQNNR